MVFLLFADSAYKINGRMAGEIVWLNAHVTSLLGTQTNMAENWILPIVHVMICLSVCLYIVDEVIQL